MGFFKTTKWRFSLLQLCIGITQVSLVSFTKSYNFVLQKILFTFTCHDSKNIEILEANFYPISFIDFTLFFRISISYNKKTNTIHIS